MPKTPKVALVYDWVTTPHGGAEKVLLALHTAFPEAPLFTAIHDREATEWAKVFEIKTSFLQNFPGAKKWYRWLSWLMPLAFEAFDFSEYDVVISVTSAEAKGILTKPHQLHLCYLLTPTRYLYSHRPEYVKEKPFFLRPFITLFLNYLEWWDQAAAHRPDIVIPISQVVAQRAHQFYHLKTEAPLYPPVSLPATPATESTSELPAQYFLIVSRLVQYKRLDLAIQACQNLELPLVVVGDGPLRNQLENLVTKPNLIYFKGRQSDAEVASLLQKAQALLMPGKEDFGITALEAQLAGKPVIVHQASGVAELLHDGQNSIFLSELTVSAMEIALQKLQQLKYQSKALTQNAQKYATTTFVQKFRDTILAAWRKGNQERLA